MMWDIGGVFFMGMRQPASDLARPAGGQWITGESFEVSARNQARRVSFTTVHRPSRKLGGQAQRRCPKGRLRLSRTTEGQAPQGCPKARRRPSRKLGGQAQRRCPKGRHRLSRTTEGQAPQGCPKARRRLSHKAKGPAGLDRASRRVARPGPSSGAWTAAAMSGGRAREASRAVEACLQGAVPVLGRVAGDQRAEAVAVVVRVVAGAMAAAAAVKA
jgi:hypothetical protein